MSIPVVYEDRWFLIADKPSGLLTVPAPGRPRQCLTDILNRQAQAAGEAYRFHPCHRLDKETSGVIVYAKGKAGQQAMMELFKSRLVAKRYVAFVQGRVPRDEGRIAYRIEGQTAITRFRVRERRRDFTVLDAIPETGRKNQIRLHMCQIGHPVVGESVFAFRKDFALRASRLCLHAQSISFVHPFTGRTVHAKSGLPADMTRFLEAHPHKERQ